MVPLKANIVMVVIALRTLVILPCGREITHIGYMSAAPVVGAALMGIGQVVKLVVELILAGRRRDMLVLTLGELFSCSLLDEFACSRGLLFFLCRKLFKCSLFGEFARDIVLGKEVSTYMGAVSKRFRTSYFCFLK